MARTLGLAASFVIFSSPTLWMRYRAEAPPYALVTAAFAAAITLLVLNWPRAAEPWARVRLGAGALVTAVAATALVAAGVHRWMQAMLWQPLDPVRGDMLAVIDAAIRALFRGRDPYGMYQVPWAAPLPYGPVLWAPFIVPHAFAADARLVTIAGQAFVPVCCAAVAVFEAARERLARASAWLVLLAAIVFNPELLTFTTVGHTPSYWPLIPLFALFVTAGQWNAAAVALALLVAGRTTMVSIVPVFFIAIWWRSRARMRGTLLIFSGVLALLLLPFFLWNPATMWDGMVASYPRVMKGFVWTSLDGGAIKTIGITGLLLARQLQAYVEVTQALVLGLVYLFAWRFIGRTGAAPLPWMALALLGFSMTTLWPVYYVYFDVLLLLVGGALAETAAVNATPGRTAAAWGGSVAFVAAAVVFALTVEAQATPAADFSNASSPALYKGFVASGGELANSAAIWGTEGSITLPRRGTSPADLVLHVYPVIPAGSGPQVVMASLNGTLLGTATVERGWRDVRFQVPASAWRAGSNRLDLQCASASVPNDIGLADDGRHLSLAIRRVTAVPR